MIRKLSVLLFAVTLGASAQTERKLKAWYKDGTSLEFSTESTGGSAKTSTSGSVMVGDTDDVHRVVIDKQGKILFEYDVEASAAPGSQDTFLVRIKPVDRARILGHSYAIRAEDVLAVSVWGSPELSGIHVVRPDGNITVNSIGEIKAAGLTPEQLAGVIRERLKKHMDVSVAVTQVHFNTPTVSAVRDFPVVKLGEAVKVEILYNPATGEKISDVLRPSKEPPPNQTSAAAAPAGDEFRLGDMQIAINGRTFEHSTGATLIGAAARIYLPGHGAYYLSIGPAPNFQEIGHASRERLSFVWGNDHIDVTSRSDVLTKSEGRVVWVFYDPNYKPREGADEVGLWTAGNAERLLPKRR